MKRGFVRAFWGISPSEFLPEHEEQYGIKNDNLFILSHKKNLNMMRKTLSRNFAVPCDVYVFGEKNQKTLEEAGVKSKLICKEPFMFHPVKEIWWHKLYLHKYLMEEEGYDEYVYLDWDCFPVREVTDAIWDELHKKDAFQAPLIKYSYQVLNHRKRIANKMIPNGGFIYIGDKSIPAKIWEYRNHTPNRWLDEAAYARYLDGIHGGWKGNQFYWDHHEPAMAYDNKTPYWKKDGYKKHIIFKHTKVKRPDADSQK